MLLSVQLRLDRYPSILRKFEEKQAFRLAITLCLDDGISAIHGYERGFTFLTTERVVPNAKEDRC